MCSALVFLVAAANAQNAEPKIYVDSTGQVFIQANSTAYFFIAPASTPGSKVLIPSTDREANPMYFDGPGSHYLVSRDSKLNRSIRFKIIADATGPVTAISIRQGQILTFGNRYYAEAGSSAMLVARDNMSGVANIFYSIDGSTEMEFRGELVFPEQREYLVRAYAIDNVGNVGSPATFRVITAIDAVIRMDNIYFDNNSARLRDESRVGLDEFAALLKQYPEVKIEIRAHTDCRGVASYNQTLSERRAQSVSDYLVDRGIARNRLTAKGYGDTQPVNECVKGVKCTEAQLQMNRRVEFKIMVK